MRTTSMIEQAPGLESRDAFLHRKDSLLLERINNSVFGSLQTHVIRLWTSSLRAISFHMSIGIWNSSYLSFRMCLTLRSMIRGNGTTIDTGQ